MVTKNVVLNIWVSLRENVEAGNGMQQFEEESQRFHTNESRDSVTQKTLAIDLNKTYIKHW